MKKQTKETLIFTGATLITAGVFPTPDDVTIISPLVQIILGSGLIIASLFSRSD